MTVGQPIYLVNYGQSVQLVCSVTSTPTHTHVYWTRIQNGLPVTISLTNTARYSGSTVNNPSLTISNVNQNDETYYICYATNTVGTGHSQQTCVDVIGSMYKGLFFYIYSFKLKLLSLPVQTLQSNPETKS